MRSRLYSRAPQIRRPKKWLPSIAGTVIESRTFTAAGVAAPTFTSVAINAQTMSAAGVGAATWNSATVLQAALSSAGAATVTWLDSAITLASLSSAGAASVSWADVAFNAQTFASAGIATVSWDGTDANGGATVIARSLSSDGVATVDLQSAEFNAVALASAGVGAFSPQSAYFEPRTITVAGLAAVAWDATDAAIIESRSFDAAGSSSATWVSDNEPVVVSLGGRSKIGRLYDTYIAPQIESAALWTGGRSQALFVGAIAEPPQIEAPGVVVAAGLTFSDESSTAFESAQHVPPGVLLRSEGSRRPIESRVAMLERRLRALERRQQPKGST